jgi:hypothetical protein
VIQAILQLSQGQALNFSAGLRPGAIVKIGGIGLNAQSKGHGEKA